MNRRTSGEQSKALFINVDYTPTSETISSQSDDVPSSPCGSPPIKRTRRMQLGERQATTASRSVGQRLKDASLKDSVLTTINPPAHGYGTAIDGPLPSSNGSAATATRMCRSALATYDRSAKSPAISLSEGQRNTVRIIGQYLRELGMNDTVDSLVEESGCRIEHNLAHQLREQVSSHSWLKAIETADKLRPVITEKRHTILRLLLLEERFKELICRNETAAALHLLQMDYPKKKEFEARQEHLATLLMTGHLMPKTNSANSESKENICKILHKILPPSVMLPPARLEDLLKQSWLHQLNDCTLHLHRHDDAFENEALVRNHKCNHVNDFPTTTTQILPDHCAEVWSLAFSPCGRYLATGAKTDVIIVYKVESPQKVSIFRKLYIPIHVVPNEVTGITFISWSHDSKYLAASSNEDNITGVFVFDVEAGTFERECRNYATESYSVACFFRGDNYKIVCGDQRGHFSLYNVLNADESPKQFEGFRIRCLYGMKDGKTVLAADTHNRIRRYDFDSMTESTIISENSQIMYFTVDRDEKYCLITTKHEGIRMWCLKTKSLIRTFTGSVHSEFIITTTFGGFYDNFVASGSEDNNVIIWNTNKSDPIEHLHGHTATVNAVDWNKKHPNMIASASDDGTVRIWSTPFHSH
jgi:WD40 repeat protein